MSEVERVNYISVGKTVGIYLTIDGEQVLFVRNHHDVTNAIRADRKKLAGLVMKMEAWTREDVDDRLIVLPKEDDGYYYPRENVLELIRTTPIGDGE